MVVTIVDKGVVLEITEDNDVVRCINKPYSVTIDKSDNKISIRDSVIVVSYDYSEVSSPTSADISELKDTLISWLNSSSTSVVEFSKANSDIAGNVQMAQPVSLADYSFRQNIRSVFFSSLSNGTGAVTHDSTTGAMNLAVTSNNDYALGSTFQSHRYIAGFPLEPEITTIGFNAETNVEKEICYMDRTASQYANGRDGVRLVAKSGTHYLECYRAGTLVKSVAREDWTDPLDGTGISGVDLGDFSEFCVFGFQFLWLGGAGLALYCYANARKNIAHVLPWSFLESGLIMKHPQKPIQVGILSTGSAGSFKFICAAVKTFGEPSVQRGDERSVTTANGGLTVAAAPALTAAIGVRLQAAYKNALLEPLIVENLGEGATDPFKWYIILNPTVAGVFTYADTTQTEGCWQEALGAATNTVTGGVVLASGLFYGRSDESHNLDFISRKIGFSLAGVADTLVLAVEPLAVGVGTVNCTLTFRQSY